MEKCKNCPVTTTGLKIVASSPDTTVKSELPSAEFLVITWTETETDALAKLLGDGKYHFTSLSQNNFTPLKLVGVDTPAQSNYHGHFFTTKVNGKTVNCLKFNAHPKVQATLTDSILRKLVVGKNYKHLITTGTGGGIWESIDVGDVVVTNHARFGLTLPPAKRDLQFNGATNLKGSSADGAPSWFDYVESHLIKPSDCVSTNLHTTGGREATSKPKIHFTASGSNVLAVVTNTHINNDHINEEKANLATYKTLGASLDENDAFIAETCKAIQFNNWVSIRNISDLPRSNNANQYTDYQYCSSIIGAYAVWAYIMGH